MEKVLKRKLEKDEDVHHRDNNKLNWHYTNLEVIGHREHGFVSSKQRWYVTNVIEPKLKAEWDEYFDKREGDNDDRGEHNQCLRPEFPE